MPAPELYESPFGISGGNMAPHQYRVLAILLALGSAVGLYRAARLFRLGRIGNPVPTKYGTVLSGRNAVVAAAIQAAISGVGIAGAVYLLARGL